MTLFALHKITRPVAGAGKVNWAARITRCGIGMQAFGPKFLLGQITLAELMRWATFIAGASLANWVGEKRRLRSFRLRQPTAPKLYRFALMLNGDLFR
jgi:hypothetical protein